MKICCVFNYNSHYREPIYKSMSENFDCDFFFGDNVFTPIKRFDATELKGFRGYLKASRIGKIIFHSGIRRIFSLKYTHYIITGEDLIFTNWLIILFARLTGRKVYAWAHGVKSDKLKLKTRIAQKMFFLPLSGVFMYNEYFCKYMTKLGCRKEKLHVIHNSLDTELQTGIYNTLQPCDIYRQHFGNDYPTIIYIGRIQKVKKTAMILEAMHELAQQGIRTNLVVVGKNVDDSDFEQKITEYGLEQNVWLYGPCFDEQKNGELIYNADVCVSPGNVGLTSIHSLTYGTPVVTNDNFNTQMPEFEAITEGVTGSFFIENDIKSLAESIKPWLGVPAEKREETRKAARAEIEKNWSVQSQIDVLKKELFHKK